MPRFSEGSPELCECIATLKTMSDEDLQAMYEQVFGAEAGNPDIEFERFKLEGLATNEEFREALIAECDVRRWNASMRTSK